MERVLFVSADGHIAPPPAAIREYLEPAFHHYLDEYMQEVEEMKINLGFMYYTPKDLELIDTHHAIRSGADTGWDIDVRLAEMDHEGVAAELILPQNLAAPMWFFDAANHPYPPEVQLAGARAYHRWVADFMAQSGGRIFGVAVPGPCLDMDEAIGDLRWCAENGFVSVSLPGRTADPQLPPLFSDYYEPFWAECEDLGMVLSIHAGHGGVQGSYLDFVDRLRAYVGPNATLEELQTVYRSGIMPNSPFAPSLDPARLWWQLMLGGVFDRHPRLKFAFTEVRADWVPATLRYFDGLFEQGGTPLKKRPSEYWRENCMTGVSSIKRSEVRLRHEIGVDKMMFGRDFPHREGTWPNTWDWLRDAFVGVPENEVRLLLGENAVRCYNLDRDKLNAIAEKIGPLPEDILTGADKVDNALIKNIEERSGYGRSHEDVDLVALEKLSLESLSALSR